MNYSKNQNKICAVIPFFNEVNSIKTVVTQTLNFVDHIVAINDGSTDGSEREISSIPAVSVINLAQNNGKGFALRQGFEYCLQNNYQVTVTLDADLQHDPSQIPKLIEMSSDYDIVVGNRLHDVSSMPFQRRLSNRITSSLLSYKTKNTIIDSQCGFRVYKTNILSNLKTKYSGFEAESEILVLAARNNCKIGFVNIPTIYGREKSKMRPIQAILGFIKVFFT